LQDEEANMTVTTVSRTITLDVGPEQVWDHLADAKLLGQWLGGTAEVDVRSGGIGHMALPDGDRSVLVTCVEPASRLSWLWWREDGETSAVDVTLRGDADGTELTIVEQVVLAEPASGSASASARLTVRV
jgi:uncharacterized protein YndB with AHSA1/START domain